MYVYFNDRASGKLRQLERKLTRHLDGHPKEEVEAWVEQWEKDKGVTRARASRMHLTEGSVINTLWKQYQDAKAASSQAGRRRRTIDVETTTFEKVIIPFFLGIHQKKDPKHWHELVPEFHVHLSTEKFSIQSRKKILWLLKRFGDSIVFSRYMSFPFAVQIPVTKTAKITPLKARKSPREIFALCEQREAMFQLGLLLGYFAALGPGELFALSREDLLTGPSAEKHSKTLKGFREIGLGSKLAVVVNKTLPATGKNNAPIQLMKNDYRFGVVIIWDVDAAKKIAELVRELDDGRLFPFSYSHLMKKWRDENLSITPHDLRRASGLYLGRELRIPPLLLQEHMRHAELDTTMLYTREPNVPEKKIKALQKWDDVV